LATVAVAVVTALGTPNAFAVTHAVICALWAAVLTHTMVAVITRRLPHRKVVVISVNAARRVHTTPATSVRTAINEQKKERRFFAALFFV
jgi:hypothetical protein